MKEKQDHSYAYLLLGCVDFSTQSSTGNIHCLPIITEFMFLNKVWTKLSFLYLNFPHTGKIESEILMKQSDLNICTNMTMKLLWHLIRNWMLSNIDYCSTLLTIFAKQTLSATTNNCTIAMHTEWLVSILSKQIKYFIY